MDSEESAVCRCGACGRVWRVLADEYGDHECSCGRREEEDEEEDEEELDSPK